MLIHSSPPTTPTAEIPVTPFHANTVIPFSPLTVALLDKALGGIQRQQIAQRTQPHDLPRNDWRNHRMTAKFFARVYIGQMHFDYRQADCGDGVPNGITIMGKRARIDNHRISPFTGILDRVDDLTLMIGLEDPDLYPLLLSARFDLTVDLVERVAPVDLRLSNAK